MYRFRFSFGAQGLPIVVPFFGEPILWLGSYNRDFGQPKKGATMETLGIDHGAEGASFGV